MGCRKHGGKWCPWFKRPVNLPSGLRTMPGAEVCGLCRGSKAPRPGADSQGGPHLTPQPAGSPLPLSWAPPHGLALRTFQLNPARAELCASLQGR